MMYGIYRDGQIVKAPGALPRNITEMGKTVFNAKNLPAPKLAEFGFFPAAPDEIPDGYDPEIHYLIYGEWEFDGAVFRREITCGEFPLEVLKLKKKQEIKEKAKAKVVSFIPDKNDRDYIIILAQACLLIRKGIDDSKLAQDEIDRLDELAALWTGIAAIAEQKSAELQEAVDAANTAEKIKNIEVEIR